jgi:hypothetical protein
VVCRPSVDVTLIGSDDFWLVRGDVSGSHVEWYPLFEVSAPTEAEARAHWKDAATIVQECGCESCMMFEVPCEDQVE